MTKPCHEAPKSISPEDTPDGAWFPVEPVKLGGSNHVRETQDMMNPAKSRIPNNSGKPEKKIYEKYPPLFHPVGIIHPVPGP